jgi:chromosomal replication initiator protein
MDEIDVASELRTRLAKLIGQDRYELWFGPQTEFRMEGESLTVVAASSFSRDWLRRNFVAELRTAGQGATGRAMRVDFLVDESPAATADVSSPPANETTPAESLEPPRESPPRESKSSGAPSIGSRTLARASRVSAPVSRNPALRSEPTLGDLVVGASNEYAYRAAEVTARGLQQASPVLFCGSTGVGKTHLLRAIRAEYRHSHPRARAVYLTAEQFITGFVEALRGSGLPSFRQKCRGADLLVLDDIQFFAGKRATLDELLHTLDVLLAEGRQIVLASDRSLAELKSLGKEMVSRLSSGLVCNIQPPDYAMRVEIVRRLAREMGVALEDDAAELVATQISTGARELRGALHRLQATSIAYGQPITRQLATSALSDLVQQCTRLVRLSDVEKAVCDVFGVEGVQLRSDRKSRSIHEPRMLAMWLARKYTRAPWSEIGAHFGRRAHSTVISAHKRMEQLIRTQAEIGVSHETCGVEEAIRRVEAALRTA